MSKHVRTLKDGFWERTTVVQAAHGSLRVRKESKTIEKTGPWAHEALRNEIAYLRALPTSLQAHFPIVLEAWEGETIGYELPFYENRRDFADLLRTGGIDQETADEMQRQLADLVLRGVHRALPAGAPPFGYHLYNVLSDSIGRLTGERRFEPLGNTVEIVINGKPLPSMNPALAGARALFEKLKTTPSVLVHGDLILENILWPDLLLIDPVSVANLSSGPPLFDLVKYESYASGELFAIREEHVRAGPEDGGYVFEIDYDHPDLTPFREIDLCSTFRSAYEEIHGEIDRRLYALLDAYFSLVMARNTSGVQQWARVLKGCQCLADAARGSEFSVE